MKFGIYQSLLGFCWIADVPWGDEHSSDAQGGVNFDRMANPIWLWKNVSTAYEAGRTFWHLVLVPWNFAAANRIFRCENYF
ncbi:MAG: hypothetical protein PHE53_04970 [Thermoguttaceae bacterium]|nr:hypothetical protein [Thermoguttaceae bacterium]